MKRLKTSDPRGWRLAPVQSIPGRLLSPADVRLVGKMQSSFVAHFLGRRRICRGGVSPCTSRQTTQDDGDHQDAAFGGKRLFHCKNLSILQTSGIRSGALFASPPSRYPSFLTTCARLLPPQTASLGAWAPCVPAGGPAHTVGSWSARRRAAKYQAEYCHGIRTYMPAPGGCER